MLGVMAVKLVKLEPQGHCQYNYTAFRTAWGWVGLAGMDGAVIHLVLPVASAAEAQRLARKGFRGAKPRDGLLAEVQEEIRDYFEGKVREFSCSVNISWASAFGQKVLQQCCKVGWGELISYGGVAKRLQCPGGARAVGAVMAKNRVPLLIPCHRVVRADGSLGGFSAEGGTAFKRRLLAHEGG